MDSNNMNGGQALNLSKSSSNSNMQRNNGSSNSSSKSSFNKNQQQGAGAQPPNFDLLASFGGDIQSAVAALAAASATGQPDVAALAANYNVLAQLASNPKLAATMLQLQQMNQPLASLAPPPPPPPIHTSSSQSNLASQASASLSVSQSLPQSAVSSNKPNYTRYQQLLSVVDEMGKDLRTTYLGNKNSMERLKRGIASARILVKDCQMECDRNTKN